MLDGDRVWTFLFILLPYAHGNNDTFSGTKIHIYIFETLYINSFFKALPISAEAERACPNICFQPQICLTCADSENLTFQ